MKRNIALRLSYDGTNYHGWQTQKEDVTIQQTVEEALDGYVFLLEIGRAHV